MIDCVDRRNFLGAESLPIETTVGEWLSCGSSNSPVLWKVAFKSPVIRLIFLTNLSFSQCFSGCYIIVTYVILMQSVTHFLQLYCSRA